MECVIFIGIQASGKSTFYKERFFNSHVRINLDMLRTRNRENIYLAASIKAMQPFVVDNTNPTVEDRRKYIDLAKEYKFRVVGYYFDPDLDESTKRNESRSKKEHVPEVAIRGTLKKLQKPELNEGFDELYTVRSINGRFTVEAM